MKKVRDQIKEVLVVTKVPSNLKQDRDSDI